MQRLVRFLCAHRVGASGKPGEDILIHVKSGLYVPGISPHPKPLWLLSRQLKAIGHTKLSQMVLDGTWENQELWPATINEKQRRVAWQDKRGFAWEWSPVEDDWP